MSGLHAGRAASGDGDEEGERAQKGTLLLPYGHLVRRFRFPPIFCDVFQHDVNQRGENVRFIVMILIYSYITYTYLKFSYNYRVYRYA